MTDPAPNAAEPDSAEPLQYYRSFTVGPDFAGKLASTSFRFILLNPAGMVRVAAVALAFVLSAYVTTVNSNGPAYALRFSGIALLAYAVLITGVALVGSRIERSRLRKRIPAGTQFSVGFRDKTILMQSPMDTAEVEFTKYQSWRRVGDFVMLQQQRSRILNFLPVECFTPESLAYLQDRLGPPATSGRRPRS